MGECVRWAPEELALLAEWYPRLGRRGASEKLAEHGYSRTPRACEGRAYAERAQGGRLVSGHQHRRTSRRRRAELRACNPAPCNPEMQEKFDALELLIMSAWRLAERQGLDVSLRDLVDTGLTLCQYQPSLLGGIISKQRRRSA